MSFNRALGWMSACLSILSGGLLTNGQSLLFAQTPTEIHSHPELYIEIQNGTFMKRIKGTTILDTNEYCFSAAYQFEMIYDSTSRIGYLFSECKQNNKRLHLKSWKCNRLTTAPISKYNDSSRTDVFTINAGDTISFYRDFRWYEPKHFLQSRSNYYSTDTIDYVVDLVDASTGQRLALLDSLGALPQVPPGSPVLYGFHPIMAHVKYIATASISGKSVFMRLQLWTRGDGLYQPIRKDVPTVGLSRALALGMDDEYMQLYGGGLGKRSDNLESPFELDSKPSSQLKVTLLTARNATIDFVSPGTDGSVSITVYDALGKLVFVPFTVARMSGEGKANFQFPSSGMFIVVMSLNNEIKSTAKVIVN